MKIRSIIWWVATGWLVCAVSAFARTWQTPVMATWTEDPRTTVTLAWERHVAGTATVYYQQDFPIGESVDAKSMVVTASESSRRHVFTLRGLKPGTWHHYRVTSSDDYEATGRFWTAPADRSQPFTFVLHNDLQGGLNSEAAALVSEGIVKANPDFVLSTGDLADSRYAGDYAGVINSWNLFFSTLANELAACVFQPVSGNHDEPENPDSFWYRLFELPGHGRDYTLDVGPIRFIMLDSTEFEAAGHTAWLARELQKAAFNPDITWVIPTFHRPPFSKGDRGGDDEIREGWVPLFTKYEAGLVLSGHAHNYQRLHPIDGVPYLVSGGGGAWLYQVATNPPDIASATSAYHFVQFQVDGPVLRLEGKLSAGTVFDRATYAAHRHVRVEPVFPVRGEACTVWYDAKGGPLAESENVTLHLGQDEFNNLLMDLPMERDAATGLWKTTFTVPDSPKWNLVFCFFDQTKNVWHNNHTRNWQALVAKEW